MAGVRKEEKGVSATRFSLVQTAGFIAVATCGCTPLIFDTLLAILTVCTSRSIFIYSNLIVLEPRRYVQTFY